MELPKRDFQHVSIHPNEEECLITETSDKGHFLLYNLRTRRLMRYELPANYQYTFAAFSPDGKQIVMVRRERRPEQTMRDQLENLNNAEIAIMNKDGSGFQTLPIPKGILVTATFSPDGKKIAYWVGKTVRSPGSKTWVADFDVREFDLSSRHDRLFSGPFNFFGINSINYLSDSALLIGATSPRPAPGQNQDSDAEFNYSEIYRLDRSQTHIPKPIFTTHFNAHNPATDGNRNIYFIDYPKKIGTAITKVSLDGKKTSWRAPDLESHSIHKLMPSRSGKYLLFIYGSRSSAGGDSKSAIGLFDIEKSSWQPVSLPSAEESAVIAASPVLQ